jgi:large subunit ribosomal protein L29
MSHILIDELREKDNEELLDLYEDLKEEFYVLRLNNATGELVDTSQFKKTRRTMARVLTVMRERELASALAEGES